MVYQIFTYKFSININIYYLFSSDMYYVTKSNLQLIEIYVSSFTNLNYYYYFFFVWHVQYEMKEWKR